MGTSIVSRTAGFMSASGQGYMLSMRTMFNTATQQQTLSHQAQHSKVNVGTPQGIASTVFPLARLLCSVEQLHIKLNCAFIEHISAFPLVNLCYFLLSLSGLAQPIHMSTQQWPSWG